VAGLDEARALMRAYPAGSDVAVHYDPARHERSRLVTQLNWHHAVLPVFAVVLLVFAALVRTMGRARGRARA
jgi:GTPase SAR1 family protein